jgi:hypothetical protein
LHSTDVVEDLHSRDIEKESVDGEVSTESVSGLCAVNIVIDDWTRLRLVAFAWFGWVDSVTECRHFDVLSMSEVEVSQFESAPDNTTVAEERLDLPRSRVSGDVEIFWLFA